MLQPPAPPQPTVISFINLKGGVAKTTTVVQLADTLAFTLKKRVLVIDLDPQTNATLALIGEKRWEQADDAQLTLAHLFLDLLNGTNYFDLDFSIIRWASNIMKMPSVVAGNLNKDLSSDSNSVKVGRVDMLPSSIRLIDVQDHMQDISIRTHYSVNPMEVLKKHVATCFDSYDYVLIDCPPNLGFVTQNGLEISDYYIIPTIPDRLSTYGIPQIAQRIAQVRQARNLKIRCLGVIITKYQSISNQHKQGLARLPFDLEDAFERLSEDPPPIFQTIMPQTNSSAEAMNYERDVKSYNEKYGNNAVGGKPAHRYGRELANEIERLLAKQL